MTQTAAFDALVTLMGIGVLAALWKYGWLPYACAKLREDLSAIEADLFHYVLDRRGGISSDSPAVKELRWEINLHREFAHRLSFSRLLLHKLLKPKLPSIAVPELKVENLESEGRRLIEELDKRKHWAIVIYTFRTQLTVYPYVLWRVSRILWKSNAYSAMKRVVIRGVWENVLRGEAEVDHRTSGHSSRMRQCVS